MSRLTLLMGARSPPALPHGGPGALLGASWFGTVSQPSPEPLEEREEEFMTGRQAERAREANRARGKHRKLTVEERETLVLGVEGLTCCAR